MNRPRPEKAENGAVKTPADAYAVNIRSGHLHHAYYEQGIRVMPRKAQSPLSTR